MEIKPRKPKKTVIIGIKVTPDFRSMVDEQAKINGVPASAFIRDAIQQKVDYQKRLEGMNSKER